LHNRGRCGECGDSYNQTKPRDNENGGKFGKGIIVRNYTMGEVIDTFVELTAVHLGHFEFRLCPLNNPQDVELENCFLSHILDFEDGKREFPVTDEERIEYRMRVKLPEGLQCERCVLQWHYLTGNGWIIYANL
jgi:hypothetical protein